jgi:hypothetical protein
MVALGTAVAGVEVPALLAAGAAAGATASATMYHNAGAPGMLLLGSHRAPASFGGVADVWLDLGQPAVLLAAGAVTAAGLGTQVVVPPTPALRGAMLLVQGAVLDGTRLVSSVPGTWALR